MKERLLQFIWQHQYFNRQLQTEDGELLEIFSPGTINRHQGPDFLNAIVRIGEGRWFGHIELHVRSSDWNRHAHQHDPNYKNVILHVVWQDDHDSPPGIPVLALKGRVPLTLLNRYAQWMQTPAFIPCADMAGSVDRSIWTAWKKQLLGKRLSRRTRDIRTIFEQTGRNWEETTWRCLAHSYGLTVNAALFGELAASLPIYLLARHRNRPDQLEALFLGQTGLLGDPPADDYCRDLLAEYRHLRHKYQLPVIHSRPRSLRMRPDNLPSIRLAQLAALLTRSTAWFTTLRETEDPAVLLDLLDTPAGPYWNDHYLPGRPAAHKIKRPGIDFRRSLLINAFIPILYAYGKIHDDPAACRKAVQWLQSIPAEKNTQIANWSHLGISSSHAADSQALLECKNHYCASRKCLDCTVGNTILRLGPPGAN